MFQYLHHPYKITYLILQVTIHVSYLIHHYSCIIPYPHKSLFMYHTISIQVTIHVSYHIHTSHYSCIIPYPYKSLFMYHTISIQVTIHDHYSCIVFIVLYVADSGHNSEQSVCFVKVCK